MLIDSKNASLSVLYTGSTEKADEAKSIELSDLSKPSRRSTRINAVRVNPFVSRPRLGPEKEPAVPLRERPKVVHLDVQAFLKTQIEKLDLELKPEEWNKKKDGEVEKVKQEIAQKIKELHDGN